MGGVGSHIVPPSRLDGRPRSPVVEQQIEFDEERRAVFVYSFSNGSHRRMFSSSCLSGLDGSCRADQSPTAEIAEMPIKYGQNTSDGTRRLGSLDLLHALRTLH